MTEILVSSGRCEFDNIDFVAIFVISQRYSEIVIGSNPTFFTHSWLDE